MKRYTYSLVLLALLPWSHSCRAQDADSAAVFKSLFKCWRAIGHEYSTIYGLEEDEIKTYSRQKICFTRDTINMYSGTLFAPRFSVKKVNAENYARENFDCGKIKLGMIADSVYEIDITSMSRPRENGTAHKLTDVIAFDGDFIYVVKDGVIFKLYDNDAKFTPRSSN